MICGIGIDVVEVHRFAHFNKYSHQQLRHIYTEQELAYCYTHETLFAQRFAVRFAAKEACYKALQSLLQQHHIFLKVAPKIEIITTTAGAPKVRILIPELDNFEKFYELLISLTHTKDIATAYALLQKK